MSASEGNPAIGGVNNNMFKKLLNHYSRRPKKNRLFLIGASIILIVALIPTIYLSFKARSASAVWYDDGYAYRKKFTFTHNADITSDRRLDITVDTATFTTDKMQADCDDTRFTDINGQALRFQEVSGCDTASTVYDVVLPVTYNGSNVFYMYYGNPSAGNASEDVSAITDLGSPSGGAPSAASEEKAPSPVAYWKFDEGTDNTCSGGTNDACDSTSNQNDAVFSGATWESEDKCVTGKCVLINSTDTITKTTNDSLVMSSSFSISAWVKINAYVNDSPVVIKRNGSSLWNYYLDTDSDGTLFLGMYDGSTFVSSGLNTGRVLERNKWYYVTGVFDDSANTLTTYIDGIQNTQATGITGTPFTTSPSDLSIGGNAGTSVMDGYLDDLKIYKYALSAIQVKAQYTAKTGGEGASAVIGSPQQDIINTDLVGYWKMDETSGNAVDSSGTGTTLTNTGTATFTTTLAKFGNATDLESGSSQYFTVADNATLSLTGNLTLAAWIKPESVTAATAFDIIGKFDGANESYQLTQFGDEIRLYIDSSSNYVETTATNLATGTWYQVTGTYEAKSGSAKIYVNGALQTTTTSGTIPTSIADDAGKFHIGAEDSTGGAGSYYDGLIDEARVYKRTFTPAQARQFYTWGPSPVGYWNFDENTGTTTLYDRSGNSNTGTMTNVATTAWVPGKYGGALEFDGTSYVRVGTGASIDVKTPITLEAWVYPTTTATFGNIITDRDGATSAIQYALRINDGTDLEYYFSDDIDFREYTQADVITLNAWNHIAASNDGTNIKLYVNGKVVLATTTAFTPRTSSAQTQISGYDTTNERFTGRIDEAKIFNYVRTPGQVVEDMNGNHPVGGSPVGSQLAYLGFDEQQGQTANDRSADGSYDGTLGATGGSSTDDPTWKTQTDCKINGCLSFDGGDFVRTATKVGPPGGFSASIWVKPNVVNTTQTLVSQYGTNAYFQFFASNQDIAFRIHQTKDTVMIGRIATGVLTVSEWQHFTATWDGTPSSAGIKIYKNGKRVDDTNNQAGSFTAASTSSQPVEVGGQDGTAFFNGTIDEVKLYSGGLTQEQVLIDMNANAAVNLSTGINEASQLSDGAGVSPIGYWKMDENTGTTTTVDSSGNNYSGTMGGMTAASWVPGKYGSALTFDGTTTKVQLADNADLRMSDTESMTFEAWVKPTSFANDARVISYDDCDTDDGDNTCTRNLYALRINTSGQINFIFGPSSGLFSGTGSTALVLNTWNHIVGVRDVTNDVVKIYLNGRQDLSTADTTTGTWETTGEYTLFGKYDAATDEFFPGTIDEVKIYNYARTQGQVAYDYNRGRPAAWWKFDECQGTTANDSSGNTQTGTITPASNVNTAAGTCTSGTATDMWNDGATGKLNASMGFDGNDDRVTAADSATLSPTTAITMALWIYPTAAGDSAGTTAPLHKGNVSSATGQSYGIMWNDQNRVFGRFGSTSGIDTLSSSIALSLNTWYHVAVTSDGTTEKIYINGRLTNSQAATVTTLQDTTQSLFIGASANNVGTVIAAFTGQIDDVRIYNYALKVDQIRKLMTDDAAARFGPSTGQP